MRRWLCGLVLLVAAQVAAAGFDEGLAAAQRGDFATALREWRPLAEQGDAVAQYNLGLMYANGYGVPEDDVEAVRWYRLSAEQGNVGGKGLRPWLAGWRYGSEHAGGHPCLSA